MPYKDPAMRKARHRNREHLKRSAVSDITAAQELEMRRKARKCPMPGCGVRLTDKPNLPNSKHLDHIVPVNPTANGTHTHGNVRIICAACNLRRPKDGSDYSGPVTLWVMAPGAVARPHGGANRSTCRKGLHPWVTGNIVIKDGKKRCGACYRQRQRQQDRQRLAPRQQCKCGEPFAAPGRTIMCPACTETAAGRAAALHAAGGVTWSQVAAEVGYGSGEGARYAARRIGYAPVRAAVTPKPKRRCQCGAPPWRQGRCRECVATAAARAVLLRGEGRTLRQIADDIGYASVTSVTNLMKTLVTIDTRMGTSAFMTCGYVHDA